MLVLPGIGGSGTGHWQTLWQDRDPAIRRFRPLDWHRPNLDDWIAALEREVAASREPPLLVAHSLACLLVAHWAQKSGRPIAGALLVAVPDPDSPAFPADAASFGGVPTSRFRFPARIVASSDDPYGSLDYARGRAREWGSSITVAGALGHINGQSGLKDWPEGWALLEAFRSGLSLARAG